MKNKIKVYALFVLFLFGLIFGTEMVFVGHKNNKVFAAGDVHTSLPDAYCMRDEYFIQTKNQHNQGLCWDFASSMAFTTTAAAVRSSTAFSEETRRVTSAQIPTAR